MHHHNGKGNNGMMWMMVLCCALPLLLLILSGGATIGGSSAWLVLGAVALMVVIHLFMAKGHTRSGEEKSEAKTDEEKDSSHSGHSCH